MILRKINRACALAFVIALGVGCKKSPPAPAAPSPLNVPSADTILRIHWLGKKKISTDTNALNVVRIWNLPESVTLEAQTLDKLSLAPWRFFGGQTNLGSTNLLRLLLEDLVDDEGYVEMRRPADPTNVTAEMILAIHLNAQRAGLWETNLAAVLESLAGIRPTNSQPGGSPSQASARWVLKKPDAPNLIEFTRVGEWTIIGAAQDHNALLDESLARIEREHAPFRAPTTNSWLEAELDLPRVASVMGIASGVRANLPKVSLTVSGDAQNVLTRGSITFPATGLLKLNPWNIPTNFISVDLGSFTAVRGFEPWLASSRFWTNLQAGPSPDQFYFWGLRGFPMETYAAAPLANAGDTVSRLSDLALQKRGSPFVTNALAGFRRSKTYNGLSWHGFPYFGPFLRSVQTNNGNFALAGFIQGDLAGGPPPPELLKEVLGRTNLVYYDWEYTGPRIGQWIYLSQSVRYVASAAQLPPDSASMRWLQALVSRAGSCGTEIIQTEPGTLSFVRNSTVGFTAIELNLLADWLESPGFPRGCHTLLAEPSEASPASEPH